MKYHPINYLSISMSSIGYTNSDALVSIQVCWPHVKSFQRISYHCKNEFIWPLNLQVHVYNFAFHAYPHTLRTILLETATIDKSLMLYNYILQVHVNNGYKIHIYSIGPVSWISCINLQYLEHFCFNIVNNSLSQIHRFVGRKYLINLESNAQQTNTSAPYYTDYDIFIFQWQHRQLWGLPCLGKHRNIYKSVIDKAKG